MPLINTTTSLNAYLDIDSLLWGAAGVGQPVIDLQGTEQATVGLNLAALTAVDFADFSLIDTHSINANVWGGGTLTGTLYETVTSSSTFSINPSNSNVTGSMSELLTATLSIKDSAGHTVAATMTDTINLSVSGTGYASGTATATSAATTQANGSSVVNGGTYTVGSGTGSITAATISVTGTPSVNLTSQHINPTEVLVVSGTETINISASENGTTVASAAETLNLNIELSGVGVVGTVSNGSGHPLTLFA